jgi:hypothetical protein
MWEQTLTGDKMVRWIRKTIIYLSIHIFLLFLTTGLILSQAGAEEETAPEIRLGEITFWVREFQSTPSPIRMLEIHIEVFNRSRLSTAPPNSIKVVVTQKEAKFPEGTPVTEFASSLQEVTLDLPLSPSTGRIFMIGFSLPETKPESITFEIQVNPPDGEKKTVKWEGSGN